MTRMLIATVAAVGASAADSCMNGRESIESAVQAANVQAQQATAAALAACKAGEASAACQSAGATAGHAQAAAAQLQQAAIHAARACNVVAAGSSFLEQPSAVIAYDFNPASLLQVEKSLTMKLHKAAFLETQRLESMPFGARDSSIGGDDEEILVQAPQVNEAEQLRRIQKAFLRNHARLS